MDAHNSDSSGSGSEAPALSGRARRKLLLQKQQHSRQKEPASATAPTVNDPAEVPTDGDTHNADPCDSSSQDQQPPITGPCKVEYCPTCGMPFEYCEFSGAACSKQAEAKDDPSEQATALKQKDDEEQLSNELQEKAAISEAKRGAGKKDGAKPGLGEAQQIASRRRAHLSSHKDEQEVVTVQKQAKRRGKCATNVWGLENFGVKPEQAAKLASKHFACGSSFQKGQPGLKPFVEIQGDVEETIAAFLLKNFGIPEDKIVFLAEK